VNYKLHLMQQSP